MHKRHSVDTGIVMRGIFAKPSRISIDRLPQHSIISSSILPHLLHCFSLRPPTSDPTILFHATQERPTLCIVTNFLYQILEPFLGRVALLQPTQQKALLTTTFEIIGSQLQRLFMLVECQSELSQRTQAVARTSVRFDPKADIRSFFCKH